MRTQARIGFLLVFILLAFQDLPTFRHWFSLRGEMLMRVDYSLYYASALQGLTAGWDKLYDLDVQRAVFARIGPTFGGFPTSTRLCSRSSWCPSPPYRSTLGTASGRR
jgi:hypothetical protein